MILEYNMPRRPSDARRGNCALLLSVELGG